MASREAFEAVRPAAGLKKRVHEDADDGAHQSSEQASEAAQAMEARAEAINVTYTAPTDRRGGSTVDAGTTGRSAGGAAVGGPGAADGPAMTLPCGSGKKYKQCHGKLA